jgi:hypothetical protein
VVASLSVHRRLAAVCLGVGAWGKMVSWWLGDAPLQINWAREVVEASQGWQRL